jgi:nucleotide-binding universal stress UspA family protein
MIQMKENMKILVPFDGSKHSKNAAKEAIDLAKKYSGSVTLLNIHWDPKASGEYDGTEIRDQPIIQIFEDIEMDLKKSGINYELRYENDVNAPNAILQFSNEEGYDTIIMGCRGIGGAKAWLLGSVSTRVAAEATCPVIIVK